MSDENTNIQNERESTADNTVGFLIEEGKKIAKEDFAKFSAIAAVIFSVGLWYIKSIWYAYWSGKFGVYEIDPCYINADSENVFLQIILVASLLIVLFISNYICYTISVSKDESRFHWKRKIKKLLFWIIEMVIIFGIVLIYGNIEYRSLIGEGATPSGLEVLIVIIIFCLLINMPAMELIAGFKIELIMQFVTEKILKRKKSKKTVVQENIEISNEKRIKYMLIALGVTMALSIIVVFLVSMRAEYDRKNYKVIMIQSEDEAESQYDIEYAADHNKYKVFPVVNENQDCYIVTRLYKQNGEIKIDYDYQKIMNKDEYETIYLEDVYRISG